MRITTLSAASIAATLALSVGAGAQDIGLPKPGQTGFQPAVTELARDLQMMDNLLLIIITAIVLLVTGLLLYVAWRFDARRNPTPQRFTHNATIEVIWTAVPVMILVAIAFPSLNLLYKQLTIPEADVTVKTIGNQWYWSYEYPDSDISFDALMVAGDYASWDDVMASEDGRADVEEYGVTRENWLLRTDAAMVVPVDAVVKVQTTANDVIHAWAMPSFGVKIDAVPGRLNELWFKAEETGTFYGQCSELCGVKHAYMPIEVKVVSAQDYADWVNEQRADAGLPPQTVTIAGVEYGPRLAQAE